MTKETNKKTKRQQERRCLNVSTEPTTAGWGTLVFTA